MKPISIPRLALLWALGLLVITGLGALKAAPVLPVPGSPAAYRFFPAFNPNDILGCEAYTTAVPVYTPPGTSCIIATVEFGGGAGTSGGGVVKIVGRVPCETNPANQCLLVTTPNDLGMLPWNTTDDTGNNICYLRTTVEPGGLFRQLTAANCNEVLLRNRTQAPRGGAIHACAQLSFSQPGFGRMFVTTDTTSVGWRLPRGGELMMLYQSYPQIGGFSYDPTGQLATVSLTSLAANTSTNTNSPTSFYWAGEETNATTAWALNFSTGRWASAGATLVVFGRIGDKNDSVHWVRCVKTIPIAAQ